MTTLVTISAPHYKADGSLLQANTTWTIVFDDSGLDTYRTSRGLLPGDAGKVQDKDSVLLALAREVHQLLSEAGSPQPKLHDFLNLDPS